MGIEAKYGLPFDQGRHPIRISQGNDGPWSHYVIKREIPKFPGSFSVTDLLYAVDFALPFGTEVLAVEDGVVHGMILCSNWFYTGLNPEVGNNAPPLSTNFVILDHNDGSMTLYSHLEGVAVVKMGSQVRKGDVIGITGRSGWIAEIPHLHFQRSTLGIPPKSLPVIFEEIEYSLDHQTMLRNGLIWDGG